MTATTDTTRHEGSATFDVGDLFYRPASKIIRDLGVLALAVLQRERPDEPLQILDAMSGSGVRTLRYAQEVDGAPFIHANELMRGEHPLRANLAALEADGRCRVTSEDAIDVYMRARLSGERYDFVDADAFGTGQPHAAEAWWAVRTGGLLYLCATDACTTAGHNPHKSLADYAGACHAFPACNEQGLRLLLGTAWREAAARRLHATPVFSFFHKPSSSFRVMLRLHRPKVPPAAAHADLGYAARCGESGEVWRVPTTELGGAATALRPAYASEEATRVMGPLWTGAMHDASFVEAMGVEADDRGWEEAAALLRTMEEEARAEGQGALLYYHLGEVQRFLAARGLDQPPLPKLIERLRAAGHGASHSHMERKALKTSASLEEIAVIVVDSK